MTSSWSSFWNPEVPYHPRRRNALFGDVSAHGKGGPFRCRTDQPPTHDPGGTDEKADQRHLFLSAPRLPGDPQIRTDRTGGDEPRRRTGGLPADGPACRIMAGVRKMGAL